jgi:hypothetical protein
LRSHTIFKTRRRDAGATKVVAAMAIHSFEAGAEM